MDKYQCVWFDHDFPFPYDYGTRWDDAVSVEDLLAILVPPDKPDSDGKQGTNESCNPDTSIVPGASNEKPKAESAQAQMVSGRPKSHGRRKASFRQCNLLETTDSR